MESPRILAEQLGLYEPLFFEPEWSWDLETALMMSYRQEFRGYDPITVLSIARRFHYLDCSDDHIQKLYDQVSHISHHPLRKKLWLKSFDKITMSPSDVNPL